MSLSESVSSGDRLQALEALRDDLAGRLELCASDQNYSTMGRLLADVLSQIEVARAAKPEAEGTALDELSRRRAVAGRPDASGSAGATRKAK